MQEQKFFDPERWAIVPASDYATGPSNGHQCLTLGQAMKTFQAELPARLSNAMRRQRELDDLKLFIAGVKSAVVLKQTTSVSAVQNEVATLVGLLREYEAKMVHTIRQECSEFQSALGDRANVVDDTAKKLTKCISQMSSDDATGAGSPSSADGGNNSSFSAAAAETTLDVGVIENILNGMIQADHLIQSSASLFTNFPENVEFKVDRAKDSVLLCPTLVTLSVAKTELKGVPPLIITKDIVAGGAAGTAAGGDALGSPGRGDRSLDTGIRRLLQLPGSEHVHGLYPRTAFGGQLSKRHMLNLGEFHKLLHCGCLRTLGNQAGNVAVNRTDFVSPLTDVPLKAGRDTYKVFAVCTAQLADGAIKNLCQDAMHLPKEVPALKDGVMATCRTVNQNFPILWFDFGASTAVRVERYVLFHGNAKTHCAMRSWRLIGTNDLPYPPGIVPSVQDDTLIKVARQAKAAINERHSKAETPDQALADSVSVTVLDVRSRESILGTHPFNAALFECCGENPSESGLMTSNIPVAAPPESPMSSASSPRSPRSPGGTSPLSPSARHQRDFCRYIGLQVTAPGAAGGYHFELSGVEFYGTMMTMSGQ